MEKELAYKIFKREDFSSKENMEIRIKQYMQKMRDDYPLAIVTREFYKSNSVLVRATIVEKNNKVKENVNEKELEKEEKEVVRIREKGINGLGENEFREITHGRGGNGRERGGR